MKHLRQLLLSAMLLLVCIIFSWSLAIAQTNVKGTVTNEAGQPLAGVTVAVKGSANATGTDEKGHFLVSASGNATLVFTSVGFTQKEASVNNQTTINVQLQAQVNSLNEVVVTAFGIKKEKKAIGYAVQEVKGADLVKAREPNALNSLSGKVSGLTITTSTNLFGDPGIYLRGVRPLIVVDGIPINSDSWNLSPDDIENYSILKGPTAAALYGSQGQNGAILITTKKGSNDKRGFSVEFNSSTQFQTGFLAIPHKQEEYGPGENYQYAYGDGAGGGINDADYDIWGPRFEGQLIPQWNSPIDSASGKLVPLPWLDRGHNNLKNFLQTGLLSTNNIAISANSDKGNMRLSVSQLYQKGLIPNTKVGGTNVNFSGTLNLSKHLQLETAINYDKQYTPNYPTVSYQPFSPIYDLIVWGGADFDVRNLRNYWVPGKVGTQQRNVENYQYSNPYFIAYEALKGYYKDDIFGHIKLNYIINDHWNAFFRSTVSSYYLNRSQRYPISISQYSGDGGYFQKGGYNESFEYFWDNNTDALLSYNNQITKNFNVRASVGGNLRTVKDNYLYGHTNNGLLVPQLFTVQNSVNPPSTTTSKTLRQVKSGYAFADFDFKEYLFLDLTGRIDQSSTLPSAHNSYFYPSASLSAVISDMIHLPKMISFWKLRASYAKVGGDFVATDGEATYNLYPTYNTGTRWNGNASEYYNSSGTLYNPAIKPSFTTSYEAGTDIRFFNNALGLDVSVFKSIDGPSIFNLPLSGSAGYSSRQINGLTTDRRGVELTLTASPIRRANGLNWNILVNLSTYQQYLDKVYDTIKNYGLIQVGQRMDQIFTRDFQRTPDGQLVIKNGVAVRNSFSTSIGNSNNDWAASIINTFSYRNFSLSFQVDGRYGGTLINYLDEKLWQGGNHPLSVNQYRLADWKNLNNPNYKGTYIANGVIITSGSLQTDGNGHVISDTRKFAANTTPVLWEDFINSYYGRDPANAFNRSYLKLREVILTYKLSDKLLSRQKLFHAASVSLVGRNMLYLAHKGLQDIDVDQWIGSSTDLETPSVRSFGVNLNFVF